MRQPLLRWTKLGILISTQYPNDSNGLTDEIDLAKKQLDGIYDGKRKYFALLFEPDEEIKNDWQEDDNVLLQANPVAVGNPDLMDTLRDMRALAVLYENKRENFLCKHCNIQYSGIGSEGYIDQMALQKCRAENAPDFWRGRDVYLGLDLSQTEDNTAVAMVALDESSEEWRSATLEIHKYQEQKAEEARKAEEQRNKEKLDKITEQYNRAISDINDEMKQHSRDREDEDIDKKIADIDRQLEYDRLDDYSRSQLEKKKQELYDEKAETQWQREHEDLKDELKTVYTMAQDIYENGTAELKSILSVASVVFGAVGTEASQVASTSSTVNNNNVRVVMNAVSQTADQIAGAVVRLISSGI